jgi:DNA primase
MYDEEGRVPGIRLRYPDGRKLSVKGGKEGLFLPRDFVPQSPVLIAEGPTDAAALLDLGIPSVVGRPSCTGGIKLLVALVQRRPAEVIIVADGDEPGRRGADNLAGVLAVYAKAVRVIRPPDGMKDAREWLRAGARRQDVEAAIAAAPERRLAVRRKGAGRGK